VIAKLMGLKIVVHPPAGWKKRAWCDSKGATAEVEMLEPRPYLTRNHQIVRACDVLLAAPKESERPKATRGQGTWSTVRYAYEAGKTVVILWP
jgi:hypothetical protein